MGKLMEWTVYDRVKDDLKLVRAENQKEAAFKGAELGVVPRRTDHVRPRTGDASLMKRDEFREWLRINFNGLE